MERLHRAGMTGREFAHLLGCAPSTVSDWSRGYRRIPPAVDYLLTMLADDPERAARYVRQWMPRNELPKRPVRPLPGHPLAETLDELERELATLERGERVRRAAERAFDLEWQTELKRESHGG